MLAYPERTTIIFSQRLEPDLNHYHSMDFLLPFKPIENKLNDILVSWFKTWETLHTVYIPYFSYYYGKDSYTSDKFLHICRSIEAYHRDTTGGAKFKPPKGSKRDYYFAERLSIVMTKTARSFKDILKIKSKKSFVNQVVDARNAFTHSKELLRIGSKTFAQAHYLAEKLNIILTCAILTEIGFTALEIKQILNSTRLYTHLRLKMR